MPRIRSLKHDLFLNEKLADLGPHHMLLFAGLWVLADKEGRLEDRPRKIAAQIFPYWREVEVDEVLFDLDENKFILRYTIGEVNYIQILSWEKHQRPHHTEKPSVIPEPKRRRKKRELTVKKPLKDGKKKSSSGLMVSGSLSMVNGKAEVDKSIAICIPLIDGSDFPVKEELLKEWEKSYPAVDVAQALNEIRAWNIANPKNQKTKGGVLRHINSWLSREQNKPPASSSYGSRLVAPEIGRNDWKPEDGFNKEEMKKAEERKKEMLSERRKKLASKQVETENKLEGEDEIPF